MQTQKIIIWAFPYRVGLSVQIFCSFLTKGFPLQSLTQNLLHKMKQNEAVIRTIELLGGVATLGQLNQEVFKLTECNWKTKTFQSFA